MSVELLDCAKETVTQPTAVPTYKYFRNTRKVLVIRNQDKRQRSSST